MSFGNFRIVIVGDLDYEDFIADIYFNDEFVAMLTQENGFEQLEIEIAPLEGGGNWGFKYSDFEKAIQHGVVEKDSSAVVFAA